MSTKDIDNILEGREDDNVAKVYAGSENDLNNLAFMSLGVLKYPYFSTTQLNKIHIPASYNIDMESEVSESTGVVYVYVDDLTSREENKKVRLGDFLTDPVQMTVYMFEYINRVGCQDEFNEALMEWLAIRSCAVVEVRNL